MGCATGAYGSCARNGGGSAGAASSHHHFGPFPRASVAAAAAAVVAPEGLYLLTVGECCLAPVVGGEYPGCLVQFVGTVPSGASTASPTTTTIRLKFWKLMSAPTDGATWAKGPWAQWLDGHAQWASDEIRGSLLMSNLALTPKSTLSKAALDKYRTPPSEVRFFLWSKTYLLVCLCKTKGSTCARAAYLSVVGIKATKGICNSHS